MDAGVMVVLATIGAVALVAVAAGVVTFRRHVLARAQTRRARALLAAHANEWASVTAGAAVTVKELLDGHVPPEAAGQQAVAGGARKPSATAPIERPRSRVRPYLP